MSDRAGRDEKGKWLPGVSGNPSGAPKGYVPFATLQKRFLAMGREELEDYETQTMGEHLAKLAILRAMRDSSADNTPAWYQSVTDRVDGKPRQETEHKITTAQGVDVTPNTTTEEAMALVASLRKLNIPVPPELQAQAHGGSTADSDD